VRDALKVYADRNHSDNDGWPAESGCGHSRFGGRVSDKFKNSAESVWLKSRTDATALANALWRRNEWW
jgi:hypothetical protein